MKPALKQTEYWLTSQRNKILAKERYAYTFPVPTLSSSGKSQSVVCIRMQMGHEQAEGLGPLKLFLLPLSRNPERFQSGFVHQGSV